MFHIDCEMRNIPVTVKVLGPLPPRIRIRKAKKAKAALSALIPRVGMIVAL
jgi:hypothetical protein